MQIFNKFFIRGVDTLIPIGITLYVLYWVAVFAESLLGDVIRPLIPASWDWPGIGLLIGLLPAMVLVFLVGLLVSSGPGRRLVLSLEADAFPALGNLPIKEITPPMVLSVIRAVESRGTLDVASRILQRTSATFRYAIQTGRAIYNPASDMKGVLKTRKIEHRATISRDELPELFKKLDSYSGDRITKLALRFIILTLVRTGELRGARWEEFDVDQREWRIPAVRMKMKSPHIVPLSPQALAVLKELRPLPAT